MDPYFFIGIVLSAVVGMMLGRPNGRGGTGAFLGFLLWPIGWLIIGISSNLNPGMSVLQGKDRRRVAEVQELWLMHPTLSCLQQATGAQAAA